MSGDAPGVRERNVARFERDVESHAGYLYTGDKLSCRLSNRRMTEAILALARPAGRRVLDVGCGDGTYTLELALAGAREVVGIDAAEAAVARARERAQDLPNVRFEVADVTVFEPREPRFDVAVVRGILHHLYDAEAAIDRICRSARRVVVVEPNGYNPVLKVLERVSPYHREHEEKSYAPRRLDRWFEARGGRVERSLYVGLVPMFCPDWMARGCKRLEPWVERTPGLRALCCGQYIQDVRLENADRGNPLHTPS